MARQCDGLDDLLVPPAPGVAISNFLGSSAGTITCWVYASGTAPTVSAAYDGDGVIAEGGGFLGLHRAIIGGADRLWAYNWDGTEDRVGLAYSADTWHFLSWRHTGGTLFVGLDGTESSVASGDTTTMTNGILFGKNYGSAYFEGRLADVRTWNIALSGPEVDMVRHGLFIRPDACTGWWPLWGEQSLEPDWSGQGRHLEVTGAIRADHPARYSAVWLAPQHRRVGRVAAAPAVIVQTAFRWRNNDGAV